MSDISRVAKFVESFGEGTLVAESLGNFRYEFNANVARISGPSFGGFRTLTRPDHSGQKASFGDYERTVCRAILNGNLH